MGRARASGIRPRRAAGYPGRTGRPAAAAITPRRKAGCSMPAPGVSRSGRHAMPEYVELVDTFITPVLMITPLMRISMQGRPAADMLRILPAGAALVLLLSAAPAMADLDDLDIPRAAPATPYTTPPQMQDPTLWTQTIYGDIPQDAGTHRMVVWCSGDALLYSLGLHIPGEGNRYHIAADSIRLNGMALSHPGYSGEGDLRTDLLQGGPITLEDGTLPLVLPGHGSLMVPVVVTGEGAAVRAVVDMSYVSGGRPRAVWTRLSRRWWGPSFRMRRSAT